MADQLEFNDFKSLLNQTFQIEAEPEKWVAAELIEAQEFKGYITLKEEKRRIPFSIVFRAEPVTQLSEKIYLIKHNQLGEKQIFLVPLQPDENGTYYEAVFN